MCKERSCAVSFAVFSLRFLTLSWCDSNIAFPNPGHLYNFRLLGNPIPLSLPGHTCPVTTTVPTSRSTCVHSHFPRRGSPMLLGRNLRLSGSSSRFLSLAASRRSHSLGGNRLMGPSRHYTLTLGGP